MNTRALAGTLLCVGLACGAAGAAFAQQGIRQESASRVAGEAPWRGGGLRLDPVVMSFGGGWGARFELLRPRAYELAPRYSLLSIERRFGDQSIAYTYYPARSELIWQVPGYRLQWSYELGARSSFGISLASGRDAEDFMNQAFPADGRQLSLFGRYWLAPDWAFSAEAMTPGDGGLLRRPTIRLGLQRQF